MNFRNTVVNQISKLQKNPQIVISLTEFKNIKAQKHLRSGTLTHIWKTKGI